MKDILITEETPNTDLIKKRNVLEFRIAIAGNKDEWVAACGGIEMPFKTRSGRILHYVYNPFLRKHAYLDATTDIILSDQEAEAFLERT
jgi:hypothetical protein